MPEKFSFLLGLFLLFPLAAKGDEPLTIPSGGLTGVLLLRNGRAIEGHIEREDNYFTVTLPDQEFRVRAVEVEYCCHDLREGYRQKKAVIQPSNIEQHLQLFQWCELHGLLDCAAEELQAAEAIDKRHPMISVLQRRLKVEREQSKETSRPAVSGPPPPSDEQLDRMTSEMPPGTVEKFVQVVQPILLNHCPGAIGYILPGQKRLQLMRPPLGEQPSRRITQRNLFAVLECIDWDNPGESPLLKASVGTGAVAAVGSFPGKFSTQYEQLSLWVYQVAQKTMPADESVVGGLGSASFADLATGTPTPATRPLVTRPGARPSAAAASKHGNEKASTEPDGNDRKMGEAPEKLPAGGHPQGIVHGTRKKAAEKAAQPAIDNIDPYDPATFNNQANRPTTLPTPAARVLNGNEK